VGSRLPDHNPLTYLLLFLLTLLHPLYRLSRLLLLNRLLLLYRGLNLLKYWLNRLLMNLKRNLKFKQN